MSTRPKVWFNGRVVAWEDAVLHASTECVLKGSNVFEGIRAYWNGEQGQLYVFRLDEHLKRLFDVSMRFLRMSLPYGPDDMRRAVIELLVANGFQGNVFLRPVVYFGEGPDYTYTPDQISTGAFILAFPRQENPQVERGIRCMVSAWRRISDTAQPPRIKAGANYLNARIAAVDARVKGFDLPIFLNDRGNVCEGSNACIFAVRNRVLITPPVNETILESLTRATVLTLCKDALGIEPEERPIEHSEIYSAEELFFCGTGAEILPIVDVDGYRVGQGTPGPLTRSIQRAYFDAVIGVNPQHREWLTPVYDSRVEDQLP